MATMRLLPLSRVEALIRRAVEEPFARFGRTNPDPLRLALHIAGESAREIESDHLPARFTLYMHPADLQALLQRYPLAASQISEYVSSLGARLGHSFPAAPEVTLVAAPELGPHQLRVAADELPGLHTQTALLARSDRDGQSLEALADADAYLIVQGQRHFPLDRPLIRIGRRMDNDLVLDSSSISRQHVQIRWREPDFVLYDVSSTGRTLVNGVACQEQVLRPGDVIALADTMLVYGEGRQHDDGLESQAEAELEQTQLKQGL